MIIKLKFGTIAMFFQGQEGKINILEHEEGAKLFCPTSSFEIEMSEKERSEGIERSLGWSNYTVNLPKGEFPLFPGLGVIYGASGAGKTQMLDFVFRELRDSGVGVRRIMFNEPDLLVSERSAAIVSETDLLNEVANFMISPDEVLFIDSIRTFIYSASGGATGKGGVDMQMYTKLTELSILAQLLGKSINVVFNPISADEQVVENIKEAVKGSVESLYFLDHGKRVLNIESRNHQAKRELVTIPFDPRTLWKKMNKETKSVVEFEEKLREGIVGPLSSLVRAKIQTAYDRVGR